MDPRSFPGMFNDPEGHDPSPRDYENYVSLGVVGHDPNDPSEAFAEVVDGQVLVEVTLSESGDSVRAYLCMEQTGPNAGGYLPVSPGDSVIVVWPGSNYVGCYIVGRVADMENRLSGTCCGLDTYDAATGKVRQFRWLVTPRGQVYAVQAGGEVLLKGGGAGVRIEGAQVLVKGAAHLGADFASPPVPGAVTSGADETASTAAQPYVPPQGSTLTEPPFTGNAKAIVRVTDGVQSNAAIDPEFWTWKSALGTYLAAVDVFIQALASLNPITIAAALGVYQAAKVAFDLVPDPTAIESQHKGASATHTCLD